MWTRWTNCGCTLEQYPTESLLLRTRSTQEKVVLGKNLCVPRLFDAVEHCFYTKWFNLNRQARTFSARTGIPLVANGDIHDLSLMGRNYTVCTGDPLRIKKRKVTVKSVPMTTLEFGKLALNLVFGRFIKQCNTVLPFKAKR